MPVSQTLIGDLEAAVQEGSHERRIEMMRRVTALFLGGTGEFSDEQIDLFDDVLTRLTDQLEKEALAELSAKLASLDKPPRTLIRNLARHEAIAVAGPVLAQSPALSDDDLTDIARTKGQAHLGAMSERMRIAAAVTDILVDRGDDEVAGKLARNQGASFSGAGFAMLAKRAETNEGLAESLGLREDISPQLFRQLVVKATDAVRARMLASARPEIKAAIGDVVEAVSDKVLQAVGVGRDFSRAKTAVARLKSSGLLDEPAIYSFASSGNYEETVVGLAQLCAAPHELVDQLMQNADYQGVLVVCKAAKLSWSTYSAIMSNVSPHRQAFSAEMEAARRDYQKLSLATAQRMFRFWIVRGVAQKQAEFETGAIN